MTEETKKEKAVEVVEKVVVEAEAPVAERPAENMIVVREAVEKDDRRRRPRPRYEDEEKEVWVPKTSIGKRVEAGEITNIDDILKEGIKIMEAGLVDKLLPGLSEEVVHVRRVQRTLDSGRRMKFSILAVVGDKNGHVGVGLAKGVEAGPTIKKAMIRAKLNIIVVKRGCASWECGCGEQHTVPYTVTGKMGSVSITLKPAPRGVGLVVGENSKVVLNFAGIKDVWLFSKGRSRTVINQVLAIYDALKKLSTFKDETARKTKDVKTKA
jgi:small subunit ribosomal protein S5